MAEKVKAWDQMARPPKDALKSIKGGRLSGMTDVNPQWRYKAMHDTYGPCGEGWKYEISRTWTEPGTEGQVFMFASVLVCVKTDGVWSDPIPGIGGSMLIQKEKGGLHNNDEAVKMAVTDALSVALKMLGVASDIYMGRWDGSKYKDAIPESSKSVKQAEWDKLSDERKQALQELAMDFLNEENAEVAYDYYCQIRDGLDLIEEKAALKYLIPKELATKFNAVMTNRTKKQGG